MRTPILYTSSCGKTSLKLESNDFLGKSGNIIKGRAHLSPKISCLLGHLVNGNVEWVSLLLPSSLLKTQNFRVREKSSRQYKVKKKIVRIHQRKLLQLFCLLPSSCYFQSNVFNVFMCRRQRRLF